MAIERGIVMNVLEFASKINKDGKVETVCSDAKVMLNWYETELHALQQKDPIKRVKLDPLHLSDTYAATKLEA